MESLLGLPIEVVVMAMLASGVRVSLSEDKVLTRDIISSLGAALFLAITSHPAMAESDLSTGKQTLIISGVAFFSRDILMILIALKDQVAKDPLGILRDYLNWRRNKND